MWFDTTNSYEMKFKGSDLIPYNSVCLKGERVYIGLRIVSLFVKIAICFDV